MLSRDPASLHVWSGCDLWAHLPYLIPINFSKFIMNVQRAFARKVRNSQSLTVGLGILLGACSGPEPPATAVPAEIALPSAPADSHAPAVPAESSLALKRGTLSMTVERATFQPCGTSGQLWVIDQTDGVLQKAFAGEKKPFDLYLEAYGERTTIPADAVGAGEHAGAFILEEVLYAAPHGEVRGCAEPEPNYVVAARGNEPFWAVEIADDKLTWRQPGTPQELVFDAVQSEDAEGTVGYSGAIDGHTIEVFFAAEPCRDSMSGAYFAYSARATFDGKQLTGCARIGS
jgi:uncharacterized membrane protein